MLEFLKRFTKRKSNQPLLAELLESRTLLSAAPQVMGYLVDYKIGNNANAVFSENSDGSVAHDTLNWKGLTQVNYFSLLPDAAPAYDKNDPSSTPEQSATSDGGLQAATDSGYNPSVQLPPLVAAAKAGNPNINVFVTVGGGDPNAIYDMDALVNSPSAWATFAAKVRSFCNQYGLAGVDMDWEPTGQSGFSVTKAQIDNYGNLIATLKADLPGLKITAEALGDPVAVSGAAPAYMLNHTAVANLNAINVEAYPVGSEAEANTIMQNWAAYVAGGTDLDGTKVQGQASQLQYGIDVSSDDTSNNAADVVEQKTDIAIDKGYGGLFIFELDSDTGVPASNLPSALSRIDSEIAKDTGGTTAAGGSISGSARTSGGAGVAGVMVWLDADNNGVPDSGERTTLTDSAGNYSFANVPAGAYVIRQALPAGDTQTSPAAGLGIHVTLASGGTLANENFIDTLPAAVTGGSISGVVRTSAGTGVSGVTVYLDANNNGKVDAGELMTMTNPSGAYSLANVPSGAYIIRQFLPAGDTQTSPSGGTGIHITVANGGTLANENFTDTVSSTSSGGGTSGSGGSVSGSVKTSTGAAGAGITVYLDANNNGKLDSGERSTTTSASGAYTFADVPAGAYIIRQVLPGGDTQTSPSGGAGIHITVANGGALPNENFTDTVAASSGPTRLTGTLIGSATSLDDAVAGHGAANAFDNNLATTFEDASANGNWVGLDLGTARTITQIKYAADPANPSFMEGGVFQASNTADFSSGVADLYQVPNTSTPTSTSLTVVNISNSAAFRYVRYLPPAGSFGDVAEVQFFG